MSAEGKPLLRLLRYKTALELPIETIREAEFSTRDGEPDLQLSAYQIEEGDEVQAVVEHFAGGLCDPPRNHPGHLNLDEIFAGERANTPGNPWFRFADGAHRELVLADVASLDALIVRMRHCPRIPFKKSEGREYVGRRVQRHDPEWVRFIREHPREGPKYEKYGGQRLG